MTVGPGVNGITNEGISVLINLLSLDISHNRNITNRGIRPLVNLTSLNLGNLGNYYHRVVGYNYYSVTDEVLSMLTKLTYLNLYNNIHITVNGIIPLVNLKKLIITGMDKKIQEEIISVIKLPNLYIEHSI